MKPKVVLVAEDMESDRQDKRRSLSVRQCASSLARKLGSSIELVHVEDLTLYPVSKPYFREFVQNFVSERKFMLKKAAHTLEVPVRTSLVEGYPVEALTKLSSRQNQYEFLVLGSHGKKGLKRALLGSVAEEVVRNSRIPVLVLGPLAQSPNRKYFSKTPIQILVATDLGKNSRKAEEYALSLAQRLSAEVLLFHSLLSGFHPTIGPAFSSSQHEYYELVRGVESLVTKQLEQKAKRFNRQGIPCSTFIDQSSTSPSSALLRHIKKTEPSLIITGTHGRKALTQAFVGSTTRELILNSPTPVLVVRSR